MCAAIIAHGNAAAVLEATEHVFDLVALPVERSFISVLDLAVFVTIRSDFRLPTF